MAKRLGEAVGEPAQLGGLFQVGAHATRSVVRDLRLLGPFLAGDAWILVG
jgi:hypothetical protein